MSNLSSNSSKFHKGQRIRHVGNRRSYIVKRAASTCMHNNEPCYQLEQVGLGPKTPSFYRTQADVESDWIDPAEEPMFGCELIRNKTSGVSFVIVGLPKFYRMYDTKEPAYLIQGPDGTRDVILQIDAEDGRFVAVNSVARHYTNDE